MSQCLLINMYTKKTIVFAGGGSGGHLIPGIALAKELQLRLPTWKIHFLIPGKPIDLTIIEKSGFSWEISPIIPFPKRKSFQEYKNFLTKFLCSWSETEKYMRRKKPSLVIGLGGYGCFPIGVLSKLHKITTIYLESNACAGKVVRWLSPWSYGVFCAIKCANILPKKIINLGLPLRDKIKKIKRFKNKKNKKFTILIVGGSQGASKINKTILQALPLLLPRNQKIQFIHILGKDMCEKKVAKTYIKNKFFAKVYRFHPNIHALYNEADLLISRAGGSTIAEITALGLVSILIPFALASEKHQQKNAQYLQEKNATFVIEEKNLTANKLIVMIKKCIDNKKLYCQTIVAAKKMGKPKATEDVASYIIKSILGIKK